MRIALIILGAVAVAFALDRLTALLIRRISRGRYRWILEPIHRDCRRPAIAVAILTVLYLAVPTWLGLPERKARHIIVILLIAGVAWLITKFLHVGEGVTFSRLPSTTVTDRRIRRARTQLRPVRRLTSVVVTIGAIGLILVTFPRIRAFGISVLGSAGVIGALIGLSARSVLANAFAGLQVAFSDSLHIGDVLVIDDEWGRVEEVKLTQVVIRLWDERMLILPSSYFTDRPFQNWTRNEARVVGRVEIELDHTADLDDLRVEARRLIESSPLWDRDRWVLQMVDVNAQAVKIEVQASAADGASAWDLRCDLRESLIRYVRDQHPQWLPRTRSEYKP
ncbi:mechanosensitive ion channel family protein [Plantactinospora siamensis]|uniref:Mechanosensitive ion channel family protein n=1 Tax=Plantactinospora siamensis TaxID=555372 RepID=A0ABV6P1Q3_9ACTN